MLNNLQNIKQTTKESIELLTQIQAEIDNILKLGLFDDSKTKQKHWARVQQLLHNEDNVLYQIENVQDYLYGIIKELDKIKPTKKDIQHRKQMLDNFVNSMKFKEYDFVGKDTLMQEHVYENKESLGKSVMGKIKGMLGNKSDSYQESNNTVVENVIPETTETMVKPNDTVTKKAKV